MLLISTAMDLKWGYGLRDSLVTRILVLARIRSKTLLHRTARMDYWAVYILFRATNHSTFMSRGPRPLRIFDREEVRPTAGPV